MQAARTPDAVYLDEQEVQAAVHSPTYLAGLWEKRNCGMVHPARLAAELARVCEERGVEILERSAARGLDTSGRRVEVRTANGLGRGRPVPSWPRTSSPRCSSAIAS